MGDLPGELWTHVLQTGLSKSILDHRDLCSLSIAGPALNRVTSLDALWDLLLCRDFPPLLPSSKRTTTPSKTIYKSRFEKVKAAKLAAHKRRCLRLESQAAVLENESKALERQMGIEKRKLLSILSDLKALEQARQSSISLRVWQPHTVRLRQQEIVEQQPVDPDFRQRSLQMEASICRQEIKICNTCLVQKRSEIEKLNVELESLTYKPVQDTREVSMRKRQIRRKSNAEEWQPLKRFNKSSSE